MRLALIVFVLFGCRPEGPVIDGHKLICGVADDQYVATCSGGGRTYKCVTNRTGCQVEQCGLVAQ